MPREDHTYQEVTFVDQTSYNCVNVLHSSLIHLIIAKTEIETKKLILNVFSLK